MNTLCACLLASFNFLSCTVSGADVTVGFMIVSVAFKATDRRAKAKLTCELIAVDPMESRCGVAAGLVRAFFRQGKTLVHQQKPADWLWKASGPNIEWVVTIPSATKFLAKCFCLEAKAMFNDSLLSTDPAPYNSKSAKKMYRWGSGTGANLLERSGGNQQQARRSQRRRSRLAMVLPGRGYISVPLTAFDFQQESVISDPHDVHQNSVVYTGQTQTGEAFRVTIAKDVHYLANVYRLTMCLDDGQNLVDDRAGGIKFVRNLNIDREGKQMTYDLELSNLHILRDNQLAGVGRAIVSLILFHAPMHLEMFPPKLEGDMAQFHDYVRALGDFLCVKSYREYAVSPVPFYYKVGFKKAEITRDLVIHISQR
jgi:hypothetical protein